MTCYQNEIDRIRENCYSNELQIATIIQTRQFIINNFDKKLNLDLLSRRQHISKFHLLRLFKRYYGLTIRQYLIETRLEKSKEFLANGMSVTETCFAVGYESPGSFSTLFKSRTGFTPSIFKNSNFR
ncbi:helix-turn-helix domain-containing protein [Fodinibius sediminis]|uniref:AraC-type DNA-binding protein n=1 Tax=Fodinibius sediminis TaxID=1214077 RepID=A0A521EM67_9BACT|nr:AraC family transcriptional regulator [Fodinibius sediminis]SMO84531.1 AraC-type DNA-binding protein [Fodinibius sediminis]